MNRRCLGADRSGRRGFSDFALGRYPFIARAKDFQPNEVTAALPVAHGEVGAGWTGRQPCRRNSEQSARELRCTESGCGPHGCGFQLVPPDRIDRFPTTPHPRFEADQREIRERPYVGHIVA